MPNNNEIQLIESRLATLFTQVEHERKLIIGSPVRSFARDIILESFHFRQASWSKFGVDITSPNKLVVAVNRSVDSFASLLWESGSYDSPEGERYLLLFELLREIRKKWCNIFPICE